LKERIASGDRGSIATRNAPFAIATRYAPFAYFCRTLVRFAAGRGAPSYYGRLHVNTYHVPTRPDQNVRWRITEITAKPTSTDSGQRWAFCGGSGLVRGARDGRSIIYRADVDSIRTLIACA